MLVAEDKRRRYIKAFDRNLMNQLRFPFDHKFWNSMDRVPHYRIVREIVVLLESGKEVKAHWAEDLSGEEQPAFSGWFTKCGNHSYIQIEPKAWKLK